MELLTRSTLAERSSESVETPANSTRSRSFYYNRVHGGYLMEWTSPAKFEAWHREKELTYSIELITSNTVHGGKL
jgi:hypothetical protein